MILVRATVNLPGLKCGRTALVDPEEPYVRKCLLGGLVIAAAPASPAPDSASGDPPSVGG
jgi:hypothetical protein